MPDLKSRLVWTIDIENEDLLLILKALGGRMTHEEDLAAARELDRRLSKLRSERLKQMANTASMIEEGIRAAQ